MIDPIFLSSSKWNGKNFALRLVLTALLLQWGCGSARRGEPIAGPMPIASEEIEEGRQVFMKLCNQCHPKGEGGVGPALNNKPLPEFMIRFQVRHGIGAMPAFSDREISDGELDHLVKYLKALRRHG